MGKDPGGDLGFRPWPDGSEFEKAVLAPEVGAYRSRCRRSLTGTSSRSRTSACSSRRTSTRTGVVSPLVIIREKYIDLVKQRSALPAAVVVTDPELKKAIDVTDASKQGLSTSILLAAPVGAVFLL